METSKRVIIFRNRLRPNIGDDYGARAEEMSALAEKMPGFLSAKDFVAEDGERLTIVEFAGAGELAAWRDNPAHRSAQREGRERWYLEYSLQVCTIERESRFTREQSE